MMPSPFAYLFSPVPLSGLPRAVKPVFSDVPSAVVRDLCALAGASSVEAVQSLSGMGFSASAAFLLTLDTGWKIFVKGSHPGDMSHGAANLRGEIAASLRLPPSAALAPPCLGFVCSDPEDDDGWWLGAWQALDRAPAPGGAAGLLGLLDRMQAVSVPDDGAWPPALQHPYLKNFFNDTYKWRRLAEDADRAERFEACFAVPGAAREWLGEALPFLRQQQERVAGLSFACGLLHGDLRCDNFLFARAGKETPDAGPRWWIVDWANAAQGPLAFDRVMLAASLVADGRMTPAAAWAWMPTGDIPLDHLRALLAVEAGYFADQLYRERPQALPALRILQAAMLFGCVACLVEDRCLPPLPAFAPFLLPPTSKNESGR